MSSSAGEQRSLLVFRHNRSALATIRRTAQKRPSRSETEQMHGSGESPNLSGLRASLGWMRHCFNESEMALVYECTPDVLCCSSIYVVSGSNSLVQRAVDPFQRPHK
jgi:hypothetical protein